MIYKAESDFSHAELLLIIEPKIPREIVFVYSEHNYVKYGDFFLNANQQLQRWSFAEPSNNKFHIYKEMPRVAPEEPNFDVIAPEFEISTDSFEPTTVRKK